MAVGINILLGTLMIGLLLPHCLSEKILMLPLPFPSLVSMHQSFGNALIEKGHEVSMVIPSFTPNFDKFAQGKIKIFAYEVTEFDMDKAAANAEGDGMADMLGIYFTYVFRHLVDVLPYYCKSAIKDQKLMADLKNEKFDIAVVDSAVATRLLSDSIYLGYSLRQSVL